MTEIYLIRHGEAEGNVFRRLHGQYDSLLTPRGHQQVPYVRDRFRNIHIDACFASDLTRASLTSRSIYLAKDLELHRDPRLREVNCGDWEDLPYGWLDRYESAQMKLFNHDPIKWRAPGAETYEDYVARMYEGVCAAARQYDGGTIAIFAHGCVIRGLLMRLFFGDSTENVPYSDNTGVSHLFYDKGVITYDFLNDGAHMPESLSTYALQRWWRATDNRREANCYFVPYSDSIVLPKGLAVPDRDSQGECYVTMLHDAPVGVVSLGKAQGDTGVILGMSLKEGMEGRMYGDQMLGQAFSRFRTYGCTRLAACPGVYPDDVLKRYEFGADLSRSIDTKCFDWRNPNAKK